jgi:hypothetical protein
MTLNYWMMLEEVGGSNPGCEISTCQVVNCLCALAFCLEKKIKNKKILHVQNLNSNSCTDRSQIGWDRIAAASR